MPDHPFEDLLRLAVDESPDQMYVTEIASGRFVDVNAGACRELGYSREELLQLHNYDVDVALTRDLWEVAAQHVGSMPGELTFRTMPLKSYTFVHRNAALTKAESNALADWLQQLRDSMED